MILIGKIGQDFSSFLKNIFQRADIIALGETNHGKHLQVFKQLRLLDDEIKDKISGIFVELPADMQTSVDYYMESGIFDKHMDDLIEGAAEEGKKFRDMLMCIFDFAREQKISVICVDSKKIPDKECKNKDPAIPFWYMKGKSRDEDMFNAIVKNYKKRKGKWLFIAHLGHAGYRSEYHSAGNYFKEEFGNNYYSACLINKQGLGDRRVICYEARNKQELVSLIQLNENDLMPFFEMADGFIVCSKEKHESA